MHIMVQQKSKWSGFFPSSTFENIIEQLSKIPWLEGSGKASDDHENPTDVSEKLE